MQMPFGALSWEKTNEHDVPYLSLAEHTQILQEKVAEARAAGIAEGWKQATDREFGSGFCAGGGS